MLVKVFISTTSFGRYDPEPVTLLRQDGIDPVLNQTGRTLTPEEVLRYAEGCIGIIAGTESYNRDVLVKFPHLKVISRCGAGLDTIDLEAARQLGIAVASTPYGPTQAVAELTVALILNLIRHVESSSARLKGGVWEKQMGFLISELKIGIMGLGKIGKQVATILMAFDATVIGHDINPDYAWAAVNHVSMRSRENLVKESDVLCLHLPYEKDLYHMIGKDELAMMKSGSYLINTSRGGLIDEEALYLALQSHHLKGAALDTFEKEPCGGPLRELDTVILTPHIGSYARAGRVKMERQSAENMINELKRLTLLNKGG